MTSDHLKTVERLKKTIQLEEVKFRKNDESWRTFRQELEDRLGLGDRPELRRKFYGFVQDCIDDNGPHVFRRLKLLLEAAVLTKEPGRWFTVAAKTTIYERGWTPHEGPLGF